MYRARGDDEATEATKTHGARCVFKHIMSSNSVCENVPKHSVPIAPFALRIAPFYGARARANGLNGTHILHIYIYACIYIYNMVYIV